VRILARDINTLLKISGGLPTCCTRGHGWRWIVEQWVRVIEPIREAAARSVVVHHSAQRFGSARLGVAGTLGMAQLVWVTLFFVLSGFCIHLPQGQRK
jgi:hypothetical protein